MDPELARETSMSSTSGQDSRPQRKYVSLRHGLPGRTVISNRPDPTAIEDYTVTLALICHPAMAFQAASACLDDSHQVSNSRRLFTEDNLVRYKLGRLGRFNTVLINVVRDPDDGKDSLGSVVRQMLRTFRNIKITLMIGTASGVSGGKHDIRPGDIAVGAHGVLHYKPTSTQSQIPMSQHLYQPSLLLRLAVEKLKTKESVQNCRLHGPAIDLLNVCGKLKTWYGKAMVKPDIPECAICCGTRVARDSRVDDLRPVVHYGLIASSTHDMMIRVKNEGHSSGDILTMDTEFAMDQLPTGFPCLLIHGITSDDDDDWRGQHYAAAVAVAYANELVCQIESETSLVYTEPGQDLHETSSRSKSAKSSMVETGPEKDQDWNAYSHNAFFAHLSTGDQELWSWCGRAMKKMGKARFAYHIGTPASDGDAGEDRDKMSFDDPSPAKINTTPKGDPILYSELIRPLRLPLETLGVINSIPEHRPFEILSSARITTPPTDDSFLDSESIRRLRNNYTIQLLPLPLYRVIESIPAHRIWVSRYDNQSLINSMKASIEDFTRLSWDWWPLEPRMRVLRNGEARLFWQCHCGRNLCETVTLRDSEMIDQILCNLDEDPPWPPRCKGKRRITAWKRRAAGFQNTIPTTSTSSASQRYTPSASGSSTRGQSSQLTTINQSSTNNYSQPSSQQHIITPTQQNTTTGPGIAPATAYSWVLFGVQGVRRTLEISHIKIDCNSTDSDFYRSLRANYRKGRGKLRLWFSFWRFDYCDVVKFKRIAPGWVIRDRKDLPTDPDYTYTPRPPTATNPPISRHEFSMYLNHACEHPCRWSPIPLHECMPQLDSSHAITAIPKKKHEFDVKSLDANEIFAWGLEAKHTISAAYVLAYHLIIVLVPFGFWGWWMKTHPDDLQGAAVPFTAVIGLFSLFWSTNGILTEGRHHARTDD